MLPEIRLTTANVGWNRRGWHSGSAKKEAVSLPPVNRLHGQPMPCRIIRESFDLCFRLLFEPRAQKIFRKDNGGAKQENERKNVMSNGLHL